MTVTIKSAPTVIFDTLRTFGDYAFISAGICAAIFVDMTGGGSLWKTMRHIHVTFHEGFESPSAIRVIKVPAQAVVAKVDENRLLAIFEVAHPQDMVAAVYQAPDGGTNGAAKSLPVIATDLTDAAGKRRR